MGYPMTYKRVVNRNSLAEGGYVEGGYNTKPWTVTADNFDEGVNFENVLRDEIERRGQEIDRLRLRLSLIKGDLRRLEADTVDENIICQVIANKTGLNPDDVAGVLKEWMEV